MRALSWISCYCSAVVAVLFAVQQPLVNAVISITVPALLLCFACYILCPAPSCCRSMNSVTAAVVDTSTTTRPQGGSSRSLYLDSIKVFLTCCVVVHHVVGAFGGNGLGLSVGVYRSTFQAFAAPFLSLQQAYFMCFFFFISALFVPGSLARKGTRAFLADKAKRLILPFSVMFFVLFPVLIGVLGGGVITKQVCA